MLDERADCKCGLEMIAAHSNNGLKFCPNCDVVQEVERTPDGPGRLRTLQDHKFDKAWRLIIARDFGGSAA